MNTTQRDPKSGYKGGLQFGSKTYSPRVKKNDSFTKKAASELASDPDIVTKGLIYSEKFTSEETGGPRAYPDGGVWRMGNRIIAMCEAKTQGPYGNASQDRWYKNHTLLLYNKGTRSLTFITGEGVRPNSTMAREFSSVLVREGKPEFSFNILYPKGSSFFANEEGFTYHEVKAIMKEWLLTKG